MPLLAEDLLLLILADPGDGTLGEVDELARTIPDGALVAELLVDVVVRLDPNGNFTRGGGEAEDSLLKAAAGILTELPQRVEPFTNSETWIAEVTFPIASFDEVWGRLRGRGAFGTAKRKRLGMFGTSVDVAREEVLRPLLEEHRRVMLGGEAPSPRTAVSILMTEVIRGRPRTLSRGESKAWDRRRSDLFTDVYWLGDDGAPREPIPGLDETVRRALGEFVVAFATAYQTGVYIDIARHIPGR